MFRMLEQRQSVSRWHWLGDPTGGHGIRQKQARYDLCFAPSGQGKKYRRQSKSIEKSTENDHNPDL
jgi:hypothetical protein